MSKGPKPRDIKARFYEKTERASNGCLEWRAAFHNGYGAFSISREKAIGAHRAAWIIVYGHIPQGMHVLHKCDNKKCVDTEHLYLGSHVDNLADAWNRGQCGPVSRKLTLADADRIRGDKRSGAALAKAYNVSEGMISMIRNGAAWQAKELKARAK
jgi:hypothetical protein